MELVLEQSEDKVSNGMEQSEECGTVKRMELLVEQSEDRVSTGTVRG